LSYQYNPTATELRQAYEVAYGKYGESYLIGALFAHVPEDTIERLYQDSLIKIKEDLEAKDLI